MPEAKFSLGQLVCTRNALDTLDSTSVHEAINRHVTGDWGDVCDEDRRSNEEGLVHGSRLLSVYYDNRGTKFWIITEANRSATTVLLPEDY